jgi:hypothetical protein
LGWIWYIICAYTKNRYIMIYPPPKIHERQNAQKDRCTCHEKSKQRRPLLRKYCMFHLYIYLKEISKEVLHTWKECLCFKECCIFQHVFFPESMLSIFCCNTVALKALSWQYT